jgi:hypothetical protein
LETYSREKRATDDFSAGIESPAEETQALALGHFDVLRIPKNVLVIRARVRAERYDP